MNLWWAFLILLMAAGSAYMGFKETRLRLQCPEPVNLTVSELSKEKTDGPLWVHLEATTTAADAAIVSSQSGVKRGVWVPVTDSKETTTVVAVLQAKDLKAARKIKASKETIQVEGLAYYPSAGASKILGTYLRQAGLKVSPDLRVVDLERKPGSIVGSLALFLLGVAVALWATTRVLRHEGRSGDRSKKNKRLQDVHNSTKRKKTQLPEKARAEVSHMLDNVWDQAQAQ